MGPSPKGVPATPAIRDVADLEVLGPPNGRYEKGLGIEPGDRAGLSPLAFFSVSAPPLLQAVEPCPSPAAAGSRALSRPARTAAVAAVVGLALAAAAPVVVALAVAASAVLALAQAGLQLRAAWRARPAPPAGAAAPSPSALGGAVGFVSVHVPICNEPPALVCRTLSALARMDGAFEVVVLDNNTTQRELWEPVRDHCLRLGRPFRFVHVDRLEGAKAGALTECLRRTSPRATHVLTVDADYAVRPDLLERAADAVRMAGAGRPVGAVQFPQAYANTGGAEGLALTYRQFFDLAMPAAARDGAALLTGTLSLVRIDALRDAGGWSAATITEDADLGARLGAAGWRVAYAPERVGRGLMPSDLCAVRAQRRRWACGNGQTLRARVAAWRAGGAAPPAAQWLQLTWWASPLAVPAAALVALAVVGVEAPAARVAALGAGWTLALALVARLAVLAASGMASGAGGAVALRAWLAERGLAWEAWTAGWEGLLGARLPFVRTRKDLGGGRVRGAGPTASLALALAASGAALALRGAPVAGALAALSGGAVALGLVVLVRELSAAARSAVPVHAEAAAVVASRPALAS